ncbi:hypothetical protein [Aliihoeflea sp. PC F10.4]
MIKAKLTAKRMLPIGAILVTATVLSGCMGPTYGTGTSSGQQTLEDVTGLLAIGGTREREEPIAYQPRGELVQPGSREVLPTPQQSAANNEAWPESPEQRLARIREDATLNQENNQYRTNVRGARTNDGGPMVDWDQHGVHERNTGANRANQREEFNRRLAQTQQGNPNQRRYLSEPPTTYRQPAATAAVGDVGEDEWRKDRAAGRAQGRGSWRDWIPGM